MGNLKLHELNLDLKRLATSRQNIDHLALNFYLNMERNRRIEVFIGRGFPQQ